MCVGWQVVVDVVPLSPFLGVSILNGIWKEWLLLSPQVLLFCVWHQMVGGRVAYDVGATPFVLE